jgi:two-component system, OmpR family, sensor kinase ParS
MKKLFVKLWLLILLTLFVSYQLQVTVFEKWRVESRPPVGSDERARRMFVLVEAILSQHPEAEWPSQIEQLIKKIGSPEIWLGIKRLTRMKEIETDARLTASQVESIRSGAYESAVFPDEKGVDVFRRVRNTEYVIVLAGPTEKRWPVLIFGFVPPTYMSWLIETSIFGLAIWLWLRLFWKDLRNLEVAAIRVGGGDFSTQIQMKERSALFPLADSFNQMTAKINYLVNAHKQLTNAVSHELRTPISRLRFRYQLAVDARSIEEKDHALNAMDSAIDQLDDLSTELLEYARLEKSEPQLDLSAIDVEPWLAELVAEGGEVARSMGRDVEIRFFMSAAYVQGDYRYLSRAAANLIRNAVRYAKTRIVVTVDCIDHRWVVTVDDDGPGIPLTEREHLFEPFARLDKSRNRASGGFGIGLAIVKQTALWHGGFAQIGDATIGGARVQIVWPIASNMTD